MIRKSIFKILLVVFFVFFISSAGYSHTENNIQDRSEPLASKKRTIRVASEYSYPPFCVVDDAGNATGFSVELLKLVLEAVGMKADFSIGLRKDIRNDLHNGYIDIVPLVEKTAAKKEIFDFTNAYISLHGSVFVRREDNRISSVEDLKDKKILVMKHTSADEYVSEKQISSFVYRVDTIGQAMTLLSEGKYDALISQHLTGVALLQDLNIENVKALTFPIDDFHQDFCFAVDKGNRSLLHRLNEGLSIVITNGEFYKLYNKWFSRVIEYDSAMIFNQVITKIFMILIPLLFIVFFIIVFVLRRQIRKKTEDLIHANKEWQKTFDAVPDMLAIVKKDSTVLKVNDAMAYSIQQAPKKIIGKKCCDFFHSETLTSTNCPHCQSVKRGEAHTLELFEERLGGYVSITVTPLKNKAGEVASFVHVVKDINEQKKTEDSFTKKVADKTKEVRQKTEDLLEAKRKYRIVADFTADWEYWLLPNNTLAYVSPSCFRITGYTAQEFIDRPQLIDDIVLPVDKDVVLSHHQNKFEPGKKQEVRFRIKTKEGSIRWIEHACQVIVENGEFLGHRASNRDITEKHAAMTESIALREQIAHMTRLHSMGELTAALAHEINQPLGAILSNAQACVRFLGKPMQDIEEVSDALVDIVSDAKRAGEVIRRLRRMVASGKPDCESFNLIALVNEVLSLLSSELVFNHVEVNTEFTEEVCEVYCDRVQIQQVLINLVKNASDAMVNIDRKKREINIIVKKTDGDWLVVVSDKGTGVDVSKIEDIFSPFHTTKKEGMGMGLAISRRILEAHKGRLWAEINTHRGMSFNFTIPLEGDKNNE